MILLKPFFHTAGADAGREPVDHRVAPSLAVILQAGEARPGQARFTAAGHAQVMEGAEGGGPGFAAAVAVAVGLAIGRGLVPDDLNERIASDFQNAFEPFVEPASSVSGPIAPQLLRALENRPGIGHSVADRLPFGFHESHGCVLLL